MSQEWKKLISTNNLKELRFIFCQTHTKANGLRLWINNNLNTVKRDNQYTQFLVRECENVDSVILARYGKYIYYFIF